MSGGARPSSYSLTRPGPLRFYSTQELISLPPPAWLIEDVLPEGGLVGLYGPPGQGKSFLAIDMAMAVATGRTWQGHPVEPGFVLYVSAEGGTGIGKRVQAWLDYTQVKPYEARVGWLTESIAVNNDSEDLDTLLGRISDDLADTPTLVIIDTLARCFDGDENTQLDMGRFIAGVDTLRRELKATVMVVHHTRLDGDRERGNTAFRGAADTMLSIARNDAGIITLTNNKQKDSEEFHSKQFALKVIEDRESCVIVSAVADRNSTILEWLAVGSLSFTELKDRAEAHGMSPATLKRALVSLRENGEIVKENGIYALK